MQSSSAGLWTYFQREKRFRTAFSVSAVLLIVAISLYRVFLEFIEGRPGVVLDDPLLPLLPPKDLTWLIFVLVYGGLVYAGTVLLRHPVHLLQALNSYTLMILLRIICMSVVPLEQPEGAIPLTDPVVEAFSQDGVTLTKDLFFSGHVATLFLLGLGMPARVQRFLFFAAAGGIGICLLFQHVHYTVDVVIAPLAAYAAFRMAHVLGDLASPGIR